MNADPALFALTRARAALVLDQPFFGTLALRLVPVARPDLATLGVDGRHLFYNPAFFLTLPEPQRLTALAHEVLHCALAHIGRRGAPDPDRWNAACDHAVNLLLAEAGFAALPGWLCDPAYAGMSAEHIYTLLPDDAGAAFDLLIDPDAADGDSSEAELATLERDWTVATLQAAAAAEAGTLPAGLARLVEDRRAPGVDWRTSLRRFLTERTRDDYSWARPNRHMLVHGLYLPSLYREGLGHAVVAVDTSGSIDAPTLAAFAAEIDSFLAEVRPNRLTVVYCDAAVAGVDEFSPGEPFAINARGGGGTAFAPVFAHVEQAGMAPSALVYLTDLYGPTAFAAPPYPVLWCCTSERRGPWGDTIRLAL